MPNWCTTDYKITGDKKQLESLYNILDQSCSEKFKDFSGFDGWLGNTIMLLGYDPLAEKPNWACRGNINYLDMTPDNEIILTTETAWSPMVETFDRILNEFFPDLDFVYAAEEPGMGIYYTNDEDLLDKYILDMGWKDGTTIYDIGTYEGKIKETIDRWFGKEFKNMEDVISYIEANREDLENPEDGTETPYFYYHQYEYADRLEF